MILYFFRHASAGELLTVLNAGSESPALSA